MNSNVAVDNNIVLYAFDKDDTSYKNQIALHIVQNGPMFSSQVLSEVVNVFNRRWKFSKDNIIRISNYLLSNCSLAPISKEDILLGHLLILRYDFQYFDALIIASALNSNCTILYSEDMQH